MNLKYRQKLHIEPPQGWLNDPNGLCFFGGKYHVYFQYCPDSAEGRGRKCWGHMESSDLLKWEYTGIVFEPDIPEDRSGVYSGCAVASDDKLHIFYTGNVKLEGDYDYVSAGREANQIHVVTDDPRKMGDKHVILRNSDYPETMSCHVRDPKVWVEDGVWKMVLGARDRSDKGLVLCYEGTDPESFRYVKSYRIDDFGYMWECPDMFEIDGHKFLSVSPQGLPHEETRFQNVYSSGYFKVEGDELKDFEELDYGFDFYAPQTFKDPKGRLILIGWMGIGDIPYTNPTTALGRQHCLTLPRVLTVAEDGGLCQNPVGEIYSLRSARKALAAGDKVSAQLPCDIVITDSGFTNLTIGGMTLELEGDILKMRLDESGFGREIRKVRIGKFCDLRIICDMSSAEVYINGGRYVMSTRCYPDGETVSVKADCEAILYSLQDNPKHLVAIGEALIDFIPDKTGVEFYEVTAFSPKIGGAPANVCGAFSRLGGKSVLLTQVGDDLFGGKIIKELGEAGLDTNYIKQTSKANTALAFVSLGADGNRDFNFYRKPSADMLMSSEDVSQDAFEDIYALHFCSVSLGDFPMKDAHKKAIEYAKKNGAIISFDPNLRPALWSSEEAMRKAVLEFIPYADILKISDEELEFITGEKQIDGALQNLFGQNVKLVVYTMGSEGAKLFTKNAQGFDPGVKVHAKDTTGAGDGFIGSLLWSLAARSVTPELIDTLNGDELTRMAAFANKFCAVSVTREGAIASYPGLEETGRENF